MFKKMEAKLLKDIAAWKINTIISILKYAVFSLNVSPCMENNYNIRKRGHISGITGGRWVLQTAYKAGDV